MARNSSFRFQPGKQEELGMKVKKVETVRASGWIWGGGGG
jgi:hypothetical protein